MRLTLRALSALLGYPSAELQASIHEVRSAIIRDGLLSVADFSRLDPRLRQYESEELLDL